MENSSISQSEFLQILSCHWKEETRMVVHELSVIFRHFILRQINVTYSEPCDMMS